LVAVICSIGGDASHVLHAAVAPMMNTLFACVDGNYGKLNVCNFTLQHRGVKRIFSSFAGYNTITVIPAGATAITVVELSPSRNYFGQLFAVIVCNVFDV